MIALVEVAGFEPASPGDRLRLPGRRVDLASGLPPAEDPSAGPGSGTYSGAAPTVSSCLSSCPRPATRLWRFRGLRVTVVIRPWRSVAACDMLPMMLTEIFGIWAALCVAIGAGYRRTAPAISLAIVGSLIGAVAGFLIGNAGGPAGVPAYTAVGASAGLVATGLIAVRVAPAHPPASSLHRAAVAALIAAPFAAGALVLLLQSACPLYLGGKKSGFCNFQDQDQLGGWVSGVVAAFLFDALFVSIVFFVSSRQAERERTRAMVT